MPTNIDVLTEAFADFRQSAVTFDSEDWSEADTRSKWIDTLLKDCLGWNEHDIKREMADAGMRLDYRLAVLMPTIIVEAKRSKVTFPVLPSKRPYKLQLKKLLTANPSLRPHIEQAAGYCHVWSIPYAVLTNGRTLIVFVGKRDDRIPLLNGEAYVIADLFSDDIDFAVVHNLLSKEAVAGGSLSRELCHARPDVSAASVLSTYLHPDAVIKNNPLSTSVEPILDRLFTDIAGDEREEIVLECYVKPGTARIRGDIELPLLDEPPVIAEKTIDIDSRHSFDEFEKIVDQRVRSTSNVPVTTLVIGNVGVGKSIFLRRFFSPNREDRVLPASVLPFFIDFRNAGSEISRLSAFIESALHKQLANLEASERVDLSSTGQLRQMFRQDYRRFERSAADLDQAEFNKQAFEELNRLKQDRSRYLAASFVFLREHYGFRPCVVLDNADHHDEEFQRQVYLAAKELQSTLQCLLFVSLQESWYWHFKERQGPLAGYHDVVFHVPAPRVRDVIAKRIDVALAKFDSYVDRQMTISFGKNMVLEPKHLRRFLADCSRTFFESDDSAVLFECIANGNVRRGLDLFNLFVRSGHATSEGYLLSMFRESGSTLTRDELLRAIAKGNHLYYSGSRSCVPNIFTTLHDIVPSYNPRFTSVFILELLASKVTDITPSVGRGFVSRSVVADLLLRLGFTPEYHHEALGRLIDAQLIAPSITGPKDQAFARFFRVTALGHYVVKQLIGDKRYLELTAVDTPITERSRLERMSKLLPEDRPDCEKCLLEAMNVFVEELAEFEAAEAEHAKELPFIQSWRAIATRLQS